MKATQALSSMTRREVLEGLYSSGLLPVASTERGVSGNPQCAMKYRASSEMKLCGSTLC